MIAFLLTIVVTIVSLMTALFLSVSQVFMITEQDLINKASDNAHLYALHAAQVEYRALRLKNVETYTLIPPAWPLKTELIPGRVERLFANVTTSVRMVRPRYGGILASIDDSKFNVTVNVTK
jgi:hypothetical protein